MRTVLTLTGLALLASLATPVAAAPILIGPSFDAAKGVVTACNKNKQKDEPAEPSGECDCNKNKKDEPAEPSGECNKKKDDPDEPSGEMMALCNKNKKDEPDEPSGECGCKKDEPKSDEPSDG